MANHILRVEAGETDAFDPGQDAHDLVESRFLPARQIGLGDIAGHHRARAETDAGQEHFHLLGAGVLCFVQDDKALAQRPPAHERQWRHFDNTFFHQPGDPLKTQHFIKGVVHRPQIGVDLLHQVPGQEPEPLARFHRRSDQDDPANLFLLQRFDSARHRQVGLARAGRTDAKSQVAVAHVMQVGELVAAAATNHLTARAHFSIERAVFVNRRHTGFAQRHVDALGIQVFIARLPVELHQDRTRGLYILRVAGDVEVVSPGADIHAEMLLDQLQVLVELATQPGQPLVVGGLQCQFQQLFTHSGNAALDFEAAAQGIRQRLGDQYIGELIDQRTVAVKIHPAIIFRTPRQLAGILWRWLFNQHALHRAHHRAADFLRLLVDPLLEHDQAPLFFFGAAGIGVGGGRRSGSCRVNETEGLVETDIGDQLHGGRKILLGLAGKADDKIRRNRDIGPYLAQAPDLLFVLQRRVAALHQGEDAIRAALHRQVQEIDQLGNLGIGCDQAVAKLYRV